MLESPDVNDRPPRGPFPWLLAASAFLFAVLLLYVLLGAYVPTKQRAARLEAELKEVYRREAALQNRIAQQEQRFSTRDQQINALVAERDTLARRVDELQRELAGRAPARRR